MICNFGFVNCNGDVMIYCRDVLLFRFRVLDVILSNTLVLGLMLFGFRGFSCDSIQHFGYRYSLIQLW